MIRSKMKGAMKVCALVLLSTIPATFLANDAMPLNTISYFNGACPDGWNNAALSSASGRFLIPSMQGGGVFSFAGEALTSQQTPSHAHASATGSIDLPAKEFILIDGCCNDSLGHSGTHNMSGSAKTGSSDLPYIQYNACMKTEAPSGKETVPSGVSTFFMSPICPTGWTLQTSASGRYIVGRPDQGVPGATFGGKPLIPGEIRTHSHDMGGTMNLPEHNIAGGSGCCAHGYAASGNTKFSGNTNVDTNAGGKYDSATQAPYFTLTFCRKD
jgi:hypothetical protein